MILAKKLNKIYGDESVEVNALVDVDIHIKKGEFVAIKGPSGCGKSTLLNIIGCLETPTKGSLYIEGTDVSNMNRSQLADLRNLKIGYVFQNFNLIATMSALENVSLPMMFAGIDKNEIEERARLLLESSKLGDRMEHKPAKLSGGERQRVAISRALSNNPPIIIADEPTGNLDSKTGKIIMDMILKLNKEGKTIVLVTHDESVANLADRILEIKDGKIISEISNK